MTRPLTIVALIVMLAGPVLPTPAIAGVEDEIELLRREVYDLRREIADLKDMVRQMLAAEGKQSPAPPAPRQATVEVAGFPSLGRADAPITIVEFSSYQCPFCRRHFDTTLPKIKAEYIDTGKVRYVFRDYPLRSQPDSPNAARAAHCAGEQGRYWDMHHVLFKNQRDLSVQALKRYAQGLGLDDQKFSTCLDSDKFASLVERGERDGIAAGVRGTPSFVIGRTPSGPSIQGRLVIGSQSFASFKQVLEQELEQISKK